MAENSKADEIIKNYTYLGGFANGENSYTGKDSYWTIPDQPKTLSTQLIDIDKFYNIYNVVSPRVEVEFRTGPGDNDWTSLKQLVSKDGIVYYARLQYTAADGTKKEVLKEAYQKDGEYYIGDNKVKIGDKLPAGEVIGFSQQNGITNNNNNFFVAATIEDNGYKTLTLELYDRTFTTIQAMLYEAIRFATSKEIKDATKTSKANTSFDLEFVKMPAATRNNIRIRYGYNDDINKTVGTKYWSQMGFNTNPEDGGFYSQDGKYRWVSRTFNDKEKSRGLTEGTSSELQFDKNGLPIMSTLDQQNVSFDNVLFHLNNQTTILDGFEEFYITNVQSNLTNTGIKYSITAVCSDAMKLNGYKFVQKYANIVDKPKNVLASLMRCFNYNGNGNNKKANQTMVKLVWNDDRDLIPAKKILPTGSGYKAYSSDEQKEEIEKNKGILAGYKEKMTAAQSLLGCLTSEAGDDYIAGNIITQKKFYPDWKMTERIATTPYQVNELKSLARSSNKTLWLSCYSQFRGFTPEEASKEAFLSYYLKNFGETRLNTRLKSESDTTVITPECDDTTGMYLDGMYFSRVMRAVLADTMAETVYDFSNCGLIAEINDHFKAKTKQFEKMDVATEIFSIIRNYIENHVYRYDNINVNAKFAYVKLPVDLIEALNSAAATQMVNACYRNRNGGLKITDFSNVDVDWAPCPTTDKWGLNGETVSRKKYSGKEHFLGKLIDGLVKKKVSSEDFAKAIEKIERSKGEEVPTDSNANFNSSSASSLAVAIAYALGVANMTAENDTTATLIKNKKLENSSYVYCCFEYTGADEYGNAKGLWSDGIINTEHIIKINNEDINVCNYLDQTTTDSDCKAFMENLDRACKRFKEAYMLEMSSLTDKSAEDNWTVLTADEQLEKICNLIKDNDFSKYKKAPTGEDKMESSFKGIDSYNGAKGNGTISNDIYAIVKRLSPNGTKKAADSAMNKDEFVELAKNITQAISKLNDKYNELSKKVSQNESAIASDEITLSLGGPESANSENRFYKSISSLLNEFCNACPPFVDYEQEIKRKEAHDKGEKVEEIAEYTDADGNKQSLDLKGDCPTFNLTWDIIGSYTDDTGTVPVVGLHYRVPKKPNMMRVYKWGSGNPSVHAIKNLNISTSSEFALLSSAANTTLKLGNGGKKVAIKGESDKNIISGESSDNIQAVYDNYKSNEEPAFFKNIVSENDQYNITDAMFQTINKGTITLLGDPSLRFGGLINPYTYPIYLDIDLQNEGTTWSSDNKATKSTLSGVYVVSKITHSLNLQGYITTLEVQRYPGINETITV